MHNSIALPLIRFSTSMHMLSQDLDVPGVAPQDAGALLKQFTCNVLGGVRWCISGGRNARGSRIPGHYDLFM